MANKKVHITLGKELLHDAARMGQVKQKLMTSYGMSDVNEQRLSRYGIMSGQLSEDEFEKVRELAEVESLDVDELKHTSD